MQSLHAGAWGDYPVGHQPLLFDPCSLAKESLARFSKPVIINDDGNIAVTARNNNTTVKGWANSATSTCSGPAFGQVHFEHLEEGNQQPVPRTCSPPAETKNIDCASYDFLGDVTALSDLCTAATCPTLTTGAQYCNKLISGQRCYTP